MPVAYEIHPVDATPAGNTAAPTADIGYGISPQVSPGQQGPGGATTPPASYGITPPPAPDASAATWAPPAVQPVHQPATRAVDGSPWAHTGEPIAGEPLLTPSSRRRLPVLLAVVGTVALLASLALFAYVVWPGTYPALPVPSSYSTP